MSIQILSVFFWRVINFYISTMVGLCCCTQAFSSDESGLLILLLRNKDSTHTGLVAPQFVGSSWTRDRTRVPCIARHILNHWTTREVPFVHFLIKLSAFLLMSCKHSLHILEARHFIRYCKSGLQICSPFCCFSFLNSTWSTVLIQIKSNVYIYYLCFWCYF